jgi:hypothetical protein
MSAVRSSDGTEIVRLEVWNCQQVEESHAPKIRHADIRGEMEEGIK